MDESTCTTGGTEGSALGGGPWCLGRLLDGSPESGDGSGIGLPKAGGFGLVAGDLCLGTDGGLTLPGGAFMEPGFGKKGTGLFGLGGITFPPSFGVSTGSAAFGGSLGGAAGFLKGNFL